MCFSDKVSVLRNALPWASQDDLVVGKSRSNQLKEYKPGSPGSQLEGVAKATRSKRKNVVVGR